MPPEYSHAHYIWYFYTAVGAAAFVALCIFRWYTNRVDARRAGLPA